MFKDRFTISFFYEINLSVIIVLQSKNTNQVAMHALQPFFNKASNVVLTIYFKCCMMEKEIGLPGTAN